MPKNRPNSNLLNFFLKFFSKKHRLYFFWNFFWKILVYALGRIILCLYNWILGYFRAI